MTNEKLKSNLEKLGFINIPSPENDKYIKNNFRVDIRESHVYWVDYKGKGIWFEFWYEFLNFYNRHKHKDK